MATGIRDKVAIIGMGCTRFGERWDMGAEELMVEAFKECLEDAVLERPSVHGGPPAITDTHRNPAGAFHGTRTLLQHTLPKMGVQTRFVDPTDPENFRTALTDRTRAIVPGSSSMGL